MKRTIAATIAAIGVATGIAAPANATPEQDYVYFSILEDNGYHITSPVIAKRNAAIVCSTLRSGTPWRLVMTRIMAEADHDVDAAAVVLAASIVAYCPDQMPPELNTAAKKTA